MGRSCPQCNSSEVERDPARGESYCTKCGTVIDSNLIVSEVQFEEGSRGGSHVIGQHVRESGSCRPQVGSMFGSPRESRQVTLSNARKKIKAVGEQLRLNTSCIEIAFNFYKRALQKRLTHGRKNNHVVAACIYITCRMEQTSHMLLDLSDVTQVNVYELGRTYLKLSSALHINIPAIDPCVYIVRFASRLDLGDKKHEIEMTAMRIVQRMKQDWIHFGRRPSGLCGSALLVAARLHDVYCSIKEIIKVVKVCEATIRKRLTEFGDTPTSRLTLDEFMQVDLEGEEDPPCFKAARLKKIRDEGGQEAVVDETGAVITDAVESTVSQLQKEIDEELEKIRKSRQKNHPLARMCFSDPGPSVSASSEVATAVALDEVSLTEEIVLQETLETVSRVVSDSEVASDSPDVTPLLPTAAVLKLCESPFKVPLSIPPPPPPPRRRRSGSVSKLTEEQPVLKEDDDDDPPDSGELVTDDLDDEELDSYILNENEAGIKRQVWETVNADWIQEMDAKAKRKEEEEAEMRLKESKGELPPPKRKRKLRKRLLIQANSAGEAIEKMLQEKRISNKINYDVLRLLDNLDGSTGGGGEAAFVAKEGDIPATAFEPPTAPPLQTVIKDTPVVTSRRLPSIRNFASSQIRLPASSIRTRSRASSIASSSYRRERTDSMCSNTSGVFAPPEEVAVPEKEVQTKQESDLSQGTMKEGISRGIKRLAENEYIEEVVDDATVTAVVREEEDRHDHEEDEELEEEEEEANESHMSIAQLMSKRMGGTTSGRDADDDDLVDDDHLLDHEDY